ncbi:MAG: hypothetical protein VB056_05245 [Sphaerochaeta associata]|uniref:hypothetical protein n=1 Tax=Sphaerochaeta associata TaxID=1129264 RepID=UPI002B2167C7|nr:hypothetical protein [Sphaerochaeta associata]MEA5028267.1 hypothetical protein [Sphaerochaeta associata]
MAKPIRVKLILERRQAGDSMHAIASTYHIAKQSMVDVCKVADSLQITYDKVKNKPEHEVYRLLFPGK